MANPAFKLPTRKNDKVNPLKPVKANEEDSESLSLMKSHSNAGSEDGESLWLLSYSDLMTLLFGFFALLMSFSKIDVESYERVRKETTLLFGGQYQKPHQQLKDELSDQVKKQGLSDKAVFDEMEKGINIVFRGSVFFDSGSADLKPEAIELLEKVIPAIQSQQSSFKVIVEGHTDDNPIQSEKFPSNWELSSHRASAVLRLFENKGFDKTLLRAIGFADTLPVAPNRDASNQPIPENQNLNRRIVLKLIRYQKN